MLLSFLRRPVMNRMLWMSRVIGTSVYSASPREAGGLPFQPKAGGSHAGAVAARNSSMSKELWLLVGPVSTGLSFSPSRAERLFEHSTLSNTVSYPMYDVSPDCQRFVVADLRQRLDLPEAAAWQFRSDELARRIARLQEGLSPAKQIN